MLDISVLGINKGTFRLSCAAVEYPAINVHM